MRWKLRMGREVGLTCLGNRYVSTLPTLSVPCPSVRATRKEGSGAAAKTGQWQHRVTIPSRRRRRPLPASCNDLNNISGSINTNARRPLLVYQFPLLTKTALESRVKRPVPHTAPSAPHLTALHRTYNTSYTRAIPYETETRKNNLLNTPFPAQLGICRESIPLPMVPLPHPRQSLREIDGEQTHPTQRDGVNIVEVSGGINVMNKIHRPCAVAETKTSWRVIKMLATN
ncbi:uncharacterized protein CLUP02_02412 [Colletotrichum lupini]|uniref:Uncharacterized protein n=1 Tax=Colletotrichum lupini TaxID=145971 RepID=A0A9Q8SHD9_9PEZI|nr:uncharacterized protein CLUP02_02412 [Colletotrichum lupini]UQC76946.1 hypothetical protein CLUP02_02412 [Colletotrichum lupini]